MRNHSSRYLTNSSQVNESILYGLFKDMTYHSKDNIKSVTAIPTDKYVGRVYSDGNCVYAAHSFTPNDIIEICPCRVIDKSALYARDIRDVVFETVPGKEYVIPMGYCQFYQISDGEDFKPNCIYQWDKERKSIIIRSITYIKKGDLLVIDIHE